MADINKTILIVDDDQDFLFQTKTKVEKLGFNTITADGQKEAEELLKETKPDLAIFDLMMENEDSGFILSYRLKKKYPDVPIIIATAVKSSTGRSFGLATEEEKRWIKADRYMDKNIRADQLEREIKTLLKL
jgi:CheY-like chemotaxis protein